jgi:hypothetical protein
VSLVGLSRTVNLLSIGAVLDYLNWPNLAREKGILQCERGFQSNPLSSVIGGM